MKKATPLQWVAILAMFVGLPIAAFVAVTGCGQPTEEVAPLPPMCANYPADYYLQCEIDTIYILDGTHDHNVVAKIPYSESDSLWAIVYRDNQ